MSARDLCTHSAVQRTHCGAAAVQVWQQSLAAIADMAAKGAVPKLKEQVCAPWSR